MDIPHNLYSLHSDLLLCSEIQTPPNAKMRKLLSTLESKRKYLLHLEMHLLTFQHNLHLLRIQKSWLKQFILLNTNLCAQVTNDFETTFCKLISNANYDKPVENVRQYRKIRLVSTWKYAQRLIDHSEFKSGAIFRENLIVIVAAHRDLFHQASISMCWHFGVITSFDGYISL